MSAAAAWLRADARRIALDPTWLLLAFAPLAIAAGARWAVPVLSRAAEDVAGAPLPPEGAAAFLLLLAPMLLGMAAGLMLLDDREENVLLSVALTPVGKAGFVRYRLALPAAWSALASAAVVPIAGLAEIHPLRLLPLALLAASETAMVALLLPAFAANKLEAMALAKAASTMMFLAFAAFLPAPWAWLGAPNPQFWPMWLFLHRGAPLPGWLLTLAAAAAIHAIAIALLLRAFRRRLG